MLTDEEFDNLAELLEIIENVETHIDLEYSGEDIG